MNVELKPDLSQDLGEATQTEGGEAAPAQTPESAESLYDLSKAEKFLYKGKEHTLKDLENWERDGLRYADYTKKTQALALERKQLRESLEKEYEPAKKFSAENLIADLYRVKQNPSLVSKFKELWGDQYQSSLDLLGIESRSEQKPESERFQISPELEARFAPLERMAQELEQKRVEATVAEVDAKFSQYMKKFGLDHESTSDFVDELATMRLQNVAKENGKLTDQDYEKVFKEISDRYDTGVKHRYTSQVQKQKEMNQRGRDVPNGGGVLGQAPKTPKTFEEATRLALQDLAQG